MRNNIPILTVAGSDCSGGAGIQADLKTFAAHGLFGMSVVLSVVAENTCQVLSCHNVPVEIVDDQFKCIFEDIPPMAIKIGMLNSSEIIACVFSNLKKYKPSNIVLDPVMFAKNGFPLMDPANCDHLKRTLIPVASIITPNIPEAEHLCGFKISTNVNKMEACRILKDLTDGVVLLKGGHSVTEAYKQNKDIEVLDLSTSAENTEGYACDLLYDGKAFYVLQSDFINTKNTHGTGCTLSSAIAANLALKKDILSAVKDAKEYVQGAIMHSLDLGRGNGPTNHLYLMGRL